MLNELGTDGRNVAGTHGEQQVALAHHLLELLIELKTDGAVHDLLARMLGAHGIGEHLRGDTRNGNLASREHINQQQFIGIGKCIGKVVAQGLQARIAVRLEHDVDVISVG